MYDSARSGDMSIFQQALPAGLPLNMTTKRVTLWCGPLRCRSGQKMKLTTSPSAHASGIPRPWQLVKLLIQHGGDRNRFNDKGQRPLAGAVFKKEDAVIEVRRQRFNRPTTESLTRQTQALIDGGADPDHGNPSALQCVEMFKQDGAWEAKFEAATGRGRAQPPDLGINCIIDEHRDHNDDNYNTSWGHDAQLHWFAFGKRNCIPKMLEACRRAQATLQQTGQRLPRLMRSFVGHALGVNGATRREISGYPGGEEFDE
ncbi:ankyrin repeat protein [Tolypocladium capitatum]|uniref:Ankyrin repeat protein n=1 Tax=Tolypocladium capitatum TaxID=45235 RepID=A0A2K3Q7Y9_9HYPO|nr:ankyrin repeat protein [Tolypocladium capitatum]